METRDNSVDVGRIIAVLLVVWAHLVNVASNDTQAYRTNFGDINLPIYLVPLKIAGVENYLAHRGTSAGGIGVSLFFLTSGYLMVGMSERYSRKPFLINRAFRIFPTLWVYVFVVVGIGWYQGLHFGIIQVIANLFLVYGLMSLPALLGVTWTLTLECYFYLLTSTVGRWTSKTIYWAGSVLFVLIEILSRTDTFNVNFGVFSFELHNIFLPAFFFLLLMLVGASIKVAESIQKNGYLIVGAVTLLCLIAMNDSKVLRPNWLGWDWNDLTICYPLFIFIFLRLISPTLQRRFDIGFIRFLGNCVYPLYLFHIPIGIGLVLLLRDKIGSSNILLGISVIGSIVFSFAIHLLIEKPGIRLGKLYLGGSAKNQ